MFMFVFLKLIPARGMFFGKNDPLRVKFNEYGENLFSLPFNAPGFIPQ